MITKTEIHEGSLGNKKGWVFYIYFNNLYHPNVISCLYKTKQTATEKCNHFVETGNLDTYGDAE